MASRVRHIELEATKSCIMFSICNKCYLFSYFRDYQGHNDGLNAHFDLKADPCPSVKVEWKVDRADGKPLLPFSTIPDGRVTIFYNKNM